MRRANAWLCLGPVLFYTLDLSLTLGGQSRAYWDGSFDKVHEASAFPRWLLMQHPLLLPAVGYTWIGGMCAMMLWLPGSLARIVGFILQFGHTLGAASWLVLKLPFGWGAAAALIFASSLLLDWTWKRQSPASAATDDE